MAPEHHPAPEAVHPMAVLAGPRQELQDRPCPAASPSLLLLPFHLVPSLICSLSSPGDCRRQTPRHGLAALPPRHLQALRHELARAPSSSSSRGSRRFDAQTLASRSR
ncbi:hypothetical protein VPH35_104097 [Triticum aestivum]